MNVVKLKNGAEEAAVLVAATMLSIHRLWDKEPIIGYELVMKCRDRNHKFFGVAGKKLAELALVSPSGDVHDSIRNIVVSAVVGDGLEMSLISPIA